MKQKRPKVSHLYNVDFVFENDSVDIWQQILDWEGQHDFRGKKSRIWSQSDHDVYFYDLIVNEQYDFIDRIPLQDDFHLHMKTTSKDENLLHYIAAHAKNNESFSHMNRFMRHLFLHQPASFTLQNKDKLTPLAMAILHHNHLFVRTFKEIICDPNNDVAHLSTALIKDLYTGLYDTYKNTATTQMMTMLNDMGVGLYTNQNLPQPYSSLSTFQEHAQQIGSKHYWKFVLEGALLAHQNSPFECHQLQAFLDVIEENAAPDDIPEEYYELLDNFMFMLQAESHLAQSQEQDFAWSGLNPIRRGLKAITNAVEIVPSICGFASIGIYIYLMVYLSGIRNDIHQQRKNLQDIMSEECHKDIKCVYWIYPEEWKCCTSHNKTTWCEENWPEIYYNCQDKSGAEVNLIGSMFFYGIFGIPATGACLLIIALIILGGLEKLESFLGQYHFQSDNKAQLHQKLQSLLKTITERCPTLLVDKPDLLLINKTTAELTHQELILVVTAMNQTLAQYHTQAQFLPNTLRIPANALQTQQSVQHLSLIQFHNDSDLELGVNTESFPLITQNSRQRGSCIIL